MSRVVAPVAMIRLSQVTVCVSPSLPFTSTVFGSLIVPHPSSSVILFFFIRKCTPLALASATLRLRAWVTP